MVTIDTGIHKGKKAEVLDKFILPFADRYKGRDPYCRMMYVLKLENRKHIYLANELRWGK